MTPEEQTGYDLGFFDGQEKMKLALANLQNQVRELRKDKERLNWLLDEESGVNVEWLYMDKERHAIEWFDDREGIDRAMEMHFATDG